MKRVLPPPLLEPPAGQSFFKDFCLLFKNQLFVTWNTWRQRPLGASIGMLVLLLLVVSLLVALGTFAYGAMESMSPQIAQGFLSLLFMIGLASQIFFGITAAFAALYMSEDLELLFMAPVPLKVVFAVKSMSVLGSNLLIAILFAFLPGVFCGLLFEAGAAFYVLVILIGIGLWLIGTAVAELINLLVMRIVPPHRSKEAIGFIGALAGIMIALVFQIPNLLLSSKEKLDLGAWLTGHDQLLDVMNLFPWGWSSRALIEGISGNIVAAIGWSMLVIILGVLLFMLAFVLLERGFRRGFISLSQGEGGRRRKKRAKGADVDRRLRQESMSSLFQQEVGHTASPWLGMWAVAKKDLLSMKRDTREWFGYMVPLIIMAFFVGQFLFFSSETTKGSLMMVLIMYTIMFSGNMALQSFGREGESDWLLNTVPLAGWPVVWGKLLATVLPTLVLMEALLVGTAVAVGVSPTLIIALVLAAILLSMGSSAIGLFYSINNSRYNPDKPQLRISPGASMIMYLVNLVFLLFLALGISYLFPPQEIISVLKTVPAVTFEGGFWSGIVYGLYRLSRPMLWPTAARVILGIIVTAGVWSVIFFGFMALTVRQSRKGFRVELITGRKRKR